MGLSNVTGASSILQPGVCTSSTRPASPYDGQVIYETDTDKVAVYDSSSWVYKTGTSHVNPAFVCVKAETAFSAAASVTVDNVFSSSYTNYRIMIRATAGGNINTFLRLRVGGVSSSAANYNRQNLYVSSTTVGGVRATGQTSFNLNGVNGAFITTNIIDIFAPFLAEPTSMQFFNNVSDGAYTTPYMYLTNANNTLSTSFDGFEVFPDSSNLTGTYTVYGYGKSV